MNLNTLIERKNKLKKEVEKASPLVAFTDFFNKTNEWMAFCKEHEIEIDNWCRINDRNYKIICTKNEFMMFKSLAARPGSKVSGKLCVYNENGMGGSFERGMMFSALTTTLLCTASTFSPILSPTKNIINKDGSITGDAKQFLEIIPAITEVVNDEFEKQLKAQIAELEDALEK